MPRMVEDRTLREAFRRGDEAALRDVYREYAGPLFGFLSRGFSFQSAGRSFSFPGFREPWELENAVQDVFVRAFSANARASYDGLRPYRTYLFTIARNVVIDGLRKRRHALVPLDDGDDETEGRRLDGDDGADPEDEAIQRELAAHVAAFVETLTAEERRLFEARFREGGSVEACADRLGASEFWVKRHEKRLRKRFFAWMRDRGWFEGFRYASGGLQRHLLLLLLRGAP